MADAEESIASSLGIVLLRSFRTAITNNIVDAVAEPINAATYPVISGVARLAPVRVAALSEQVGLERSVVARRAALLADAGLLQIAPDPDDARATLLSLTPDGEHAVAVMRQHLVDGIATHLHSWSQKDRRAFAALFARFVQTDLGAPETRTGHSAPSDRSRRHTSTSQK